MASKYPEREYQFNIVASALAFNTLVSLPTGLGKTFIAAVVMHNYFRWFRDGLVIFMAPTKPLVLQQIEACHKIVGLPEGDTAQLLGGVGSAARAKLWRERRVIYCTPQTLRNDLEKGRLDARRVVLLVIDEAHRATGQYAYCQVIKLLDAVHQRYRILALSATPGTDLERVQSVIDSLHITRVEARSERDPDIAQYTHDRTIDRITVELSKDLSSVQDAFAQSLRPVVLRLCRYKLLMSNDPRKLNTMSLLKCAQELRDNPARFGIPQDEVMDIRSCVGLLQRTVPAMAELTMHGTHAFFRSLQRFVQEAPDTRPKRQLLTNDTFRNLLMQLEGLERAGRHLLHPKLIKLDEKLREHFTRARQTGVSTRVIVFTETRNSVAEILKYLRQRCTPWCLPAPFVGQAGSRGGTPAPAASASSAAAGGKEAAATGQSQREQQEVIRNFRAGTFNTLVATSIGEEGLDIGEVGLIVLFDSSGSPVRTVQRIGRTGRQSAGEIVALVTPGTESSKFDKAFRKYRNVSQAIRREVQRFRLFEHNPDMIPELPCMRVEMGGTDFHLSQVGGARASDLPSRKQGADIRKAFGVSSTQDEFVRSAIGDMDSVGDEDDDLDEGEDIDDPAHDDDDGEAEDEDDDDNEDDHPHVGDDQVVLDDDHAPSHPRPATMATAAPQHRSAPAAMRSRPSSSTETPARSLRGRLLRDMRQVISDFRTNGFDLMQWRDEVSLGGQVAANKAGTLVVQRGAATMESDELFGQSLDPWQSRSAVSLVELDGDQPRTGILGHVYAETARHRGQPSSVLRDRFGVGAGDAEDDDSGNDGTHRGGGLGDDAYAGRLPSASARLGLQIGMRSARRQVRRFADESDESSPDEPPTSPLPQPVLESAPDPGADSPGQVLRSMWASQAVQVEPSGASPGPPEQAGTYPATLVYRDGDNPAPALADAIARMQWSEIARWIVTARLMFVDASGAARPSSSGIVALHAWALAEAVDYARDHAGRLGDTAAASFKRFLRMGGSVMAELERATAALTAAPGPVAGTMEKPPSPQPESMASLAVISGIDKVDAGSKPLAATRVTLSQRARRSKAVQPAPQPVHSDSDSSVYTQRTASRSVSLQASAVTQALLRECDIIDRQRDDLDWAEEMLTPQLVWPARRGQQHIEEAEAAASPADRQVSFSVDDLPQPDHASRVRVHDSPVISSSSSPQPIRSQYQASQQPAKPASPVVSSVLDVSEDIAVPRRRRAVPSAVDGGGGGGGGASQSSSPTSTSSSSTESSSSSAFSVRPVAKAAVAQMRQAGKPPATKRARSSHAVARFFDAEAEEDPDAVDSDAPSGAPRRVAGNDDDDDDEEEDDDEPNAYDMNDPFIDNRPEMDLTQASSPAPRNRRRRHRQVVDPSQLSVSDLAFLQARSGGREEAASARGGLGILRILVEDHKAQRRKRTRSPRPRRPLTREEREARRRAEAEAELRDLQDSQSEGSEEQEIRRMHRRQRERKQRARASKRPEDMLSDDGSDNDDSLDSFVVNDLDDSDDEGDVDADSRSASDPEPDHIEALRAHRATRLPVLAPRAPAQTPSSARAEPVIPPPLVQDSSTITRTSEPAQPVAVTVSSAKPALDDEQRQQMIELNRLAAVERRRQRSQATAAAAAASTSTSSDSTLDQRPSLVATPPDPPQPSSVEPMSRTPSDPPPASGSRTSATRSGRQRGERAIQARTLLFERDCQVSPEVARLVATETVNRQITIMSVRDMFPAQLVAICPGLCATDAAKLRNRLRKLLAHQQIADSAAPAAVPIKTEE